MNLQLPKAASVIKTYNIYIYTFFNMFVNVNTLNQYCINLHHVLIQRIE